MTNPAVELGVYSGACRESFEMLALDSLSQDVTARILEVSTATFTPLGGIALGGDPDLIVYAGLKTRQPDSVKRVAQELFLGDQLLLHREGRVNSLPLFTLPVAGTGGDDLGILTEDFTQDGTKKLDEQYLQFSGIGVERERVPEGLYSDVYDALGGNVYSEAFGHMMGWVGHHEVLVDFDDVATPPAKVLDRYEEFAEALTLVIDT